MQKPTTHRKKVNQKVMIKKDSLNYKKYINYLNSDEWLNLKIDLISIRGRKCEQCKKSVSNLSKLHVHHITYVRLFKELPVDLKLLCKGCHYKEHTNKPNPKKKKYKKEFKYSENDLRHLKYQKHI